MQEDLSSEDKDSQSQRSGGSTSLRKEASDAKGSKSSVASKTLSKNTMFTEEALLDSEYFDTQIVSLEPKDISDRTISSFERYLALVNSMYFG
jgi:hypothetical protein